VREREVRWLLVRFSSRFRFSNKSDLRFGCLLLLLISLMVAGIEELGDMKNSRSAVLGMVGEIPGAPIGSGGCWSR
jgi:hypothetical protein